MILVTSWDDGHPLDMKLANMLRQHQVKGTFFIPIKNAEGLPTLQKSDVLELGEDFEIGAHTFDHLYLPGRPKSEVFSQILTGKYALEDILGKPVNGFCYPGGKFNKEVISATRNAKFSYARTTSNMWSSVGDSPFLIPTTFQLYPHSKSTFIRNYLSQGHFLSRRSLFKILISTEWSQAIDRVIDYINDKNGILHIWGHSWELEKYGLWPQLERLLLKARSCQPDILTMQELVDLKFPKPLSKKLE